jgi:hypothetical protein
MLIQATAFADMLVHLLLHCQVSKYFYENEEFAAKFESFVNDHANEGKQSLQSTFTAVGWRVAYVY